MLPICADLSRSSSRLIRFALVVHHDEPDPTVAVSGMLHLGKLPGLREIADLASPTHVVQRHTPIRSEPLEPGETTDQLRTTRAELSAPQRSKNPHDRAVVDRPATNV
jgi:hypothetical protein